MGLKAWLGPPANLAGKKESVASDLIGGVARLREKAAKTRAFTSATSQERGSTSALEGNSDIEQTPSNDRL
jgi:hypothetical protein